jgi:hypothetical protein
LAKVKPGNLTRRSFDSRLAAMIWVLALTASCSVHYYDQKSGTEHLWGFGHMRMRAVPRWGDEPPFTNAVMAFATGVRTLGLHVGAGEEFGGLVAGWDSRSRMVIASEHAHFCLFWPTNAIWLPWDLRERFFTVRVGPDFPFTNSTFTPNSTTKSPTP